MNQNSKVPVEDSINISFQPVNAYDDDNSNAIRAQDQPIQQVSEPSYCEKVFNWFPLRTFGFFGGMILVAFPILDYTFTSVEFISFFVYLYLILFGLIIMFVESPSWKLTRFFQLRIYFWSRILSRIWGRAFFYFFASILCFSDIGSVNATQFAGAYMMGLSLIALGYSKLAANKYNRIFFYIQSKDNKDNQLNDTFAQTFAQTFAETFDELDVNNIKKIGSLQIIKLSRDANVSLSNAERHAIQSYLDRSCNGYVTKEDWMIQWTKNINRSKKQFL